MKKLTIKKPKFFISAIITALAVIAADLHSKFYIFELLDHTPYQHIKLTSFFNLVKVYNPGVSFGMFQDLAGGQFILSAFAVCVTLFLAYWLMQSDKKHVSLALGAIIGGAYGNIIDRFFNGAVADFLDIHIAGHHWPAFNVADSAITIGALILIYDEFFLQKKKAK